ncbi:MAG: hypothetical protein HC915_03275 [Anaerolineae bacterium]|nr:hypothetical protein [Anaerolineae bacterium]
MQTSLIIGLLALLAVGVAVGLQGTLTSLLGQQTTPIWAGFFIHLGGAVVGAVIIAVAHRDAWPVTLDASLVRTILITGILGMIVLPGIAFAFPRTGLVAGQSTIIFGQMLIAVLVDTLGWAGRAPLSLDPQRLAGLLLMAVATYLLLPR